MVIQKHNNRFTDIKGLFYFLQDDYFVSVCGTRRYKIEECYIVDIDEKNKTPEEIFFEKKKEK